MKRQDNTRQNKTRRQDKPDEAAGQGSKQGKAQIPVNQKSNTTYFK